MFLIAGQVYHGFQGGVQEFGDPDQGNGQQDDCPILHGDAQPE